jgi:DNA-binding MarR family transcriptional regulator
VDTEPTDGGQLGPFTPDGLVGLMRALTRSVQEFLAQRAKQMGLDASAFVALIRIADSQGLTGAELGAMLGLRSSSITELADRLETAGVIKRSPHPTDRRSVLLVSTARGRRLVERALGPLLGRVASQSASIDGDARQVIGDFLTGIGAALDEVSGG